jgi:hypothetical protein
MRSWIMALGLLLGLTLPALQAGTPARAEEHKKSGEVSIDQVQVAFIFSGNLGGGKLMYKGKTYDFTIGGLGVGGIGASSIQARGTVYDLERLEDFPGAYGQARAGFVAGDVSSGDLWLQNSKGVYMSLKAERQGLALSLGADAIYIDFD